MTELLIMSLYVNSVTWNIPVWFCGLALFRLALGGGAVPSRGIENVLGNVKQPLEHDL